MLWFSKFTKSIHWHWIPTLGKHWCLKMRKCFCSEAARSQQSQIYSCNAAMRLLLPAWCSHEGGRVLTPCAQPRVHTFCPFVKKASRYFSFPAQQKCPSSSYCFFLPHSRWRKFSGIKKLLSGIIISKSNSRLKMDFSWIFFHSFSQCVNLLVRSREVDNLQGPGGNLLEGFGPLRGCGWTHHQDASWVKSYTT